MSIFKNPESIVCQFASKPKDAAHSLFVWPCLRLLQGAPHPVQTAAAKCILMVEKKPDRCQCIKLNDLPAS